MAHSIAKLKSSGDKASPYANNISETNTLESWNNSAAEWLWDGEQRFKSWVSLFFSLLCPEWPSQAFNLLLNCEWGFFL
jgi:hypothetical protein